MKNNWKSIKERPTPNKRIIACWINVVGEVSVAITRLIEMPRHCFENPPIDDRYWIERGSAEIKPILWKELEELPTVEDMKL